MPADDGLHRMSTEDLAAFLRRLRALRMREGLGVDGLAAQPELPPGSDAAGQPGFTITRVGLRHAPPRRRWRPSPGLVGVTATAIVLAGLAAGGAVLTEPTGHSQSSAPSAPLPGSGRSMTSHRGRMHMPTQPAAPSPAGPRPAPPGPHRARMSGQARVRVVVPVLVRPARMSTEVAGVGCPGSPNDGISLAGTSAGPGWTTAGGGWTGNGCDGSSVWSLDPNGNQASPSTLTWFFYPSMQASSCRLAVFVPSQNALGVGSYQVSAGSASLGSVSIDQAGSEGEWVPLGSYPATGSMLTVQLLPGTATLTAVTGATGPGGNGNGNGGNGGSGKSGNGHSGSGGGPATPTPSPASGHNAAVAASAARASCR
jgi:hypothetical protein